MTRLTAEVEKNGPPEPIWRAIFRRQFTLVRAGGNIWRTAPTGLSVTPHHARKIRQVSSTPLKFSQYSTHNNATLPPRSAGDCGFNRSMQRTDEIVGLVFRNLVFSSNVRSNRSVCDHATRSQAVKFAFPVEPIASITTSLSKPRSRSCMALRSLRSLSAC